MVGKKITMIRSFGADLKANRVDRRTSGSRVDYPFGCCGFLSPFWLGTDMRLA